MGGRSLGSLKSEELVFVSVSASGPASIYSKLSPPFGRMSNRIELN